MTDKASGAHRNGFRPVWVGVIVLMALAILLGGCPAPVVQQDDGVQEEQQAEEEETPLKESSDDGSEVKMEEEEAEEDSQSLRKVFDEVEVGMTENEVKNRFGDPNFTSTGDAPEGKATSFLYANDEDSVAISFQDGKAKMIMLSIDEDGDVKTETKM